MLDLTRSHAADLPRLFGVHPDNMPDRYALMIEGACLEPEVQSGAMMLFSKTEPYSVGDLIALYLRPERVKPGGHQVVVKRLVMLPPASLLHFGSPVPCHANADAMVIATMLNPPCVLGYPVSQLLGIHKCLGPIAEENTSPATLATEASQ